MNRGKSKFALFFGNRDFFSDSLAIGAREEVPRVLKDMGHEVLMMAEDATPFGAVKTTEQGQLYANWLRGNRAKFDGVILCLPNFGDESAAVAALEEAGVPILVQAYPDEADKMSPVKRRDAFCGKISIADVFCQYGVKFTVLKPHTVSPSSARFRENISFFDSVCRIVTGMRKMTVGAIGARTTAFKTVRFDELALQAHGITVETLDMSEVMARVRELSTSKDAYKAKAEAFKAACSWDGVPDERFESLVKVGVVVDQIAEEYQMDALALRCWIEVQKQLGISLCALIGIMNDGPRPVACEVDVGNAVAMYALALASDGPAGVLDWNNNYNDEDDKCILFHCGSMPPSMMTARGHVTDHAMLALSLGEGCSYGCNQGRIAASDFTFGSVNTAKGKVKCFLGEGGFTDDPIAEDFFGCAGVVAIPQLQDVLLHVCRNGYRHHVSVSPGHYVGPLVEALEGYLGFEVALPQEK